MMLKGSRETDKQQRKREREKKKEKTIYTMNKNT